MKLSEIRRSTDLKVIHIKQWLDQQHCGKYFINDDYSIDIEGDIVVGRLPEGQNVLPYNFNRVTGNFIIRTDLHIHSLQGCPKIVGNSFECEDADINSLQHCPPTVGGSFICGGCTFTSLHNVHKYVKQVGAIFHCPTVKSNILGLCFVKELKRIDLENDTINAMFLRYRDDINMFQEALIESGYPEMARV